MPRDIPIGEKTMVRRRRCHVGHVAELYTRRGQNWALVEMPPRTSRDPKDAALRELVNFASRVVPVSDVDGDDPILVEAGQPVPECCAPTARVYLHESDRAMMDERVRYGEDMLAGMGAVAGDPVSAHVAAVRHALVYTCKGDVHPDELVHAIELVYLPNGTPLPSGGRFELLDKKKTRAAS